MLRKTRKITEFRTGTSPITSPCWQQYEKRQKSGVNLKKVKCQSGVKVLQEKRKKKQYRLFCSCLCSLRGVEQGTWKVFWLRKDDLVDLYNEGS